MTGLNSLKSKVDLVIAWPRHMDYPLWRKQLRAYRGMFETVNIVFTYMNVDMDYRNFVKEAMKDDHVTFMNNDPVTAVDDWRNIAVNKALGICRSEWIFFTEQDFFWKDGFWDFVSNAMEEVPYIRAMVDTRAHPCCIFLKREVLSKTRQDFGVIRDVSDHFSKLQQDLFELDIEYKNIPQELWHHMSGLSQDMWLTQNHKPITSSGNDFRNYVQNCLGPGIVNHPDFEKLFCEYLQTNTMQD